MLTEVNSTVYSVVVQGRTIATNIPSLGLAEATVFSLSAEDRALAEIIPTTTDGKQVLLG